MNHWLAAMAVLALGGCAITQPPPATRIPFPQAEYDALPKSGTGTITGQAFLKTRGGDVKTAAGTPVVLNPVTSYSRDWFKKVRIEHQTIEAADPKQQPYLRQKIADAAGKFTFDNVPAGRYYVVTAVQWEAPTGYRASLETQGGMLVEEVEVSDGKTVEIVMTR